LCTKLTVVI
jgi:hypothetical protein